MVQIYKPYNSGLFDEQYYSTYMMFTPDVSSCRHRSMEKLVERLEQAVIRLEEVSVKLQGRGMANGDIVNGMNGGE